MKRTYLKFSANGRGLLPTVTSRHLQLKNDGQHTCYRGGNDDDDDDDIDKKLSEVKSALEKTLTKKQREALEQMEEALEEKMAKRLEKKNTEIAESIEKANKQLAEMQEAATASKKSLEESTKKTEELEKTVTEQKERADKNQEVIDAFVVNKDKEKNETKNKSFESIIKDAVLERTDEIQKFARKETKNLVIDLKVVGDMTTGNVTTGTRYGQIFAPNIIQQPYRKVHVRDLIPTDTAGPGNTFTFMREVTTGEGDVAPTAETATKPQLDLDLAESTVNFETIAGWLRVTRKAMNNIPGFIAWLQRRLPEKLMRVEDAQSLYGDGISPNLKGINHADNHTAETSSATVLAEKIIDAISQLEDANERYATGVIVRPKEYYNFFKNKAGGSGEYDLPRNFTFVNGVLYVSGIPVIPTTAVVDGDFFVGDWLEGTQLLIQEAMRLEFFEQDGTNVRENKITVRIEETVALPVYGASFFIKGEVPAES